MTSMGDEIYKKISWYQNQFDRASPGWKKCEQARTILDRAFEKIDKLMDEVDNLYGQEAPHDA